MEIKFRQYSLTASCETTDAFEMLESGVYYVLKVPGALIRLKFPIRKSEGPMTDQYIPAIS